MTRKAEVALGLVPVWAFIGIHLLGAGVDLGAFAYESVEGPSRDALRKFGWIMVYLTIWNQLTQGLYFAFALLTDLFLRSDTSDVNWKWLHRSDSASFDYIKRTLSEKAQWWLKHRDRFFALAWVTGNMVGIGFWCLLFPHKSVRDHVLASPHSFIMTLIAHGFTWIMINVEMFTVRHRYASMCIEATLVVIYGACYLGWNITVHAVTGDWAYPSIQSGHSLPTDLGLYAGLFCLFVLLYFTGRLIATKFWGWQESRSGGSQSDSHLLAGDIEAHDRGIHTAAL